MDLAKRPDVLPFAFGRRTFQRALLLRCQRVYPCIEGCLRSATHGITPEHLIDTSYGLLTPHCGSASEVLFPPRAHIVEPLPEVRPGAVFFWPTRDGNEVMACKAMGSISPARSMLQRAKASRVRQKDLPCQRAVAAVSALTRRCNIHCWALGHSMTRQPEFRVVMTSA